MLRKTKGSEIWKFGQEARGQCFILELKRKEIKIQQRDENIVTSRNKGLLEWSLASS